MKKVKVICTIGIILGIAIIVLGIVVMASDTGYHSTDTPRDAAFGGDYYTEQYNATRIAAKNASATAGYVSDLADLFARYMGFGFIVTGALVCFVNVKKIVIGDHTAATPIVAPPIVALTSDTAPVANDELPDL